MHVPLSVNQLTMKVVKWIRTEKEAVYYLSMASTYITRRHSLRAEVMEFSDIFCPS